MIKKIMFFTAPWCASCKSLKPHIDKVQDKIEVEWIDVEERGEEATAYGVTNLPTLFFIHDGELVKHRTGATQTVVQEIYAFAEDR